MTRSAVDIYDTTLRDGLQGEGLALTVDDKLRVARQLDALGVRFIEGGWPGAIPRDTEFFRRAQDELELQNAALVAFGATRRPDVSVVDDPQVDALVQAGTGVVTLVAKSDLRHVEQALHTTPQENLAMVRDTVRHLRALGRRVFVDAEHFFDGFNTYPGYASEVVGVAADAGAEAVVLCDTNGGTQPDRLAEMTAQIIDMCDVPVGVHCHDDGGCAVANSLLAVAAGATQVQVTAHGYGERCGNADLFGVLAGLQLKRGIRAVTDDQLALLRSTADSIAAITHVPTRSTAAYVGRSAFAHKAGLHASAIRTDPSLYQHINPSVVGNERRMLVSDMAGRASVQLKATEFGYDLPIDDAAITRTVARVKELEERGFSFDSADASFELLLREQLDGHAASPFNVTGWTASIGSDAERMRAEAVVDVEVDGNARTGHCSGTTPVSALIDAARDALLPFFPALADLRLVSHSTQTIDLGEREHRIRARLELDGIGKAVSTVGVAEDASAASWRALHDGLSYVLRDTPAIQRVPSLSLVKAS